MTNLDELRREFPPADLTYARRHSDGLYRAARAYNDARRQIDPAVDRTIKAARRLKARLLEESPTT